MTVLRPIGVEGVCGHKFSIIYETSIKYYIHPKFLQDLISGNKTHHECPECKETVTILFGLVVDILRERILLHPVQWKDTKDKDMLVKPEEIVIYDDFNSSFPNLIAHLKQKGVIINDHLGLAEEYIPKGGLRGEMLCELGVWEPKPKK